ncbi:hypothetical protein SAMN05428974_0461 [Sphingopyxis sp. YR583]|uniref:hypothetical protein n=1 Tax=Sphingopyxis sp. YR583 TaxID=1881047 RepID=UPI0008A757D6|nr:hypothetical protein [Sphingopyxis sp. YR583]SEH12398.1 hypothetical protein SAMN05428974_0461 [Sphingopyxis sp. YR583]
MIIRVASVTMAVLMVTGCATNSASSEAERLKVGLARVEAQCGAKPGTLKLDSDNLVAVAPEPDAKYETFDCVFRELKKPEFANHIKLGFVGNEAYAAEEQK